MQIVFFAHPAFLGQQSMPRFARMLFNGMKERGHKVELWMPQPRIFKLPVPVSMRKWMGYIDQYVLFPAEVRKKIKRCHSDTLFVFTDHALGPWVPLVANRPHVIHCHDFLAQRSALGEISENYTSWTGRQYQSYIRSGYSKGENFVSVSLKSKDDLHQFLSKTPKISEVVYNGLNQEFAPRDQQEARDILSKRIGIDLANGYLLHVGGNQWYKNRVGVIHLYNAWRSITDLDFPLLLIGQIPDEKLLRVHAQSPIKNSIHLLSGIEDTFVRIAYAGASLFLFPSLAEGFGWPIAEAMASGCPVITTNEAPMTEVAGNAGFLISRCPKEEFKISEWAKEGAQVINKVINLRSAERQSIVSAGLINAKRFDSNLALNKIEAIYQMAMQNKKKS